jgi:hypothetical protein
MRNKLLMMLILGSLCAGTGGAEENAKADSFRSFQRITKHICLRCHRGAEPKGGLDLSSREGVLRGGDSGPAIELGDPEASLLLRRVIEGSMPPIGDGEPLAATDIDELRRWIQFGAPWATERPTVDSPPSAVKEHVCVTCQAIRGQPCANYRLGAIRRRLRTRSN